MVWARSFAGWVAAAAIVLHAGIASGQDKDRGRRLFEEAGAEFEHGGYARAEALYAESFAAYPAPTALFWQARALEKLGRLIEARDCYRKAAEWPLDAAAPPAFVSTVAQAKSELATIEKDIPAIVVNVDDAAARVTIDGAPLPQLRFGERTPVDPGRHVVIVEGDGYRTIRREVDVERGRTADVSVAVAPSDVDVVVDEEGPPAVLVAGVVVGGVGLASLVVWGVTGALYLDRASTVEEHCDGAPGSDGTVACDAEGFDAASEGETLGVVNTVMLFAGLGALAVGTALVITGLTSDGAASRLVPEAGPGYAGVSWRDRF